MRSGFDLPNERSPSSPSPLPFHGIYSGDNINGYHPSERTPDPERLLSAYFHSATTLNYIRALLASDFASLTAPRSWSFSHVRSPVLQAQFEDVISRLTDSLDFMTTIGAPLPSTAQGVEIFTSHEGLSLEFEETQTRHLPRPETEDERSTRLNKGHSINPQRSPSRAGRRGQNLASSISSLNGTPPAPPPCAYYNTGSHYLWIGDRTRQVEGGHVEYFRGLENPVGVKVGPTMPKGELTRLLASVSDCAPCVSSGIVSLLTVHRYSSRPQPRAGQGVAHLPLRRRQSRGLSRQPHRRGRGLGPPRRLGLRPHARQHQDGRELDAQDARLW